MPRITYVNGRYLPHGTATVHVEDRGYQFADGVYEVIPLIAGRLVDEAPHLDRLGRSLDALRIAWPMGRAALAHVCREIVRRNRLTDGIVYLQVTRGTAPRNHAFPRAAETTLVVTGQRTAKKPAGTGYAETGVAVITIPDIRWRRCDIKSVSLLPNVLGKQQAVEAGAYEAWMIDGDGRVTEGTSSNAWIVTKKGTVVTRPVGDEILAGITRSSLLNVAAAAGVTVEERAFTVAEIAKAAEAFLTSSSAAIIPVVSVDGKNVGDGKPGPVTRALQAAYRNYLSGRPVKTRKPKSKSKPKSKPGSKRKSPSKKKAAAR